MLIDSHAHLYDIKFKDDLEKVIARAKDNNIQKIILVGYNNETNIKSVELTNKYDIFDYTCGIHPSYSKKDFKKEMKLLEEFLTTNSPKAIGECGLDYYYFDDNKDDQKELFEFQINLGIKYDLPIVIHTRDSIEDTYNILNKYKGKITGVLHCYSGDLEYAMKFIDLGFYISLAGPVTYKNALAIKEVATKIPLDRLLLETDAPYLPPQDYRGKRNESSYLQDVAYEITTLRNIQYNEVVEQTTKNTKKIFNLK